MARKKKGAPSKPNISRLMSREEMGLLVTPQNTAAMPQAAAREGEI